VDATAAGHLLLAHALLLAELPYRRAEGEAGLQLVDHSTYACFLDDDVSTLYP